MLVLAVALGASGGLAGAVLGQGAPAPAGAVAPLRGRLEAAARRGVLAGEVLASVAGEGRARILVLYAAGASRARTAAAIRAPDPLSRALVRARSDAILRRVDAADFELYHRFASIGAFAGRANARALAALAEDPDVIAIGLDAAGHGGMAEAGPLVDLPAVVLAGRTGAGVTVAVLDTGVDLAHADFAGAVVGEQCFCFGVSGCCPNGAMTQSGAGSAQDDHGHGTNVSGIILSGGATAQPGAARDADLVAVKVLDASNEFSTAGQVIAGLDWVYANRPDVGVVNMSLGTFALYAGVCDAADAVTLAFAASVANLYDAGVLLVASSMNDGSGTEMAAPACLGDVLSVGAVWDSDVGSRTLFGCTDATTQADQVTCFSNSNATTDLFAPGAPTTSSKLGGGVGTFFGTSQAAAIATGCAAALLEGEPSATPASLEAALVDSPVDVTDPKNGLDFPRLDCEQARLSLPEAPGGAGLSLAALALLRAAERRVRRALAAREGAS